MEYQGKSRAKPLRMSGESLVKVGRKPRESHLTPTVARVHNGRYEHEQRPFSMFITVDVRQLVAWFYPILTPLLPNKMLALA